MHRSQERTWVGLIVVAVLVLAQAPDGTVFQPQPTWMNCPALEVVYAENGIRILRLKPTAE
jgi:hypothetical protein